MALYIVADAGYSDCNRIPRCCALVAKSVNSHCGLAFFVIKVNLIDVLTNHSKPAYGFRKFSPFVKPRYVDYCGSGATVSVYTDKSLDKHIVLQDETDIKVAWLVECREVHPFAYDIAADIHDVFDYVFTFDKHLLKMGDKFIKTL